MSTTATPVRSCPTTSSSEYRKPPKAKRHSTPRSNSPPRSRTQPQTHGNDAPRALDERVAAGPVHPVARGGAPRRGGRRPRRTARHSVAGPPGDAPVHPHRRPPGDPSPPPRPGLRPLEPTEPLRAGRPSPPAAANRLGRPEAERAGVILVDGRGQCNLQARGARAPFLTSEFLPQTGQSAYPSTTAANISFLGTG